MFNSLKSKLIIPITGVLICMVLIIIAYVYTSTVDLVSDLTDERVQGMSSFVSSWIESFDEQVRVASLSVARSPEVVSTLLDWNAGINRAEGRLSLLEYMGATAGYMGVTAFVVHDAAGHVVLRTHAPHLYSDDDNHLPFVQAARRGESTLGYASTGTMPMGLSATTPVFHEGENIGSVATLFFLHTEEFVDSISEIFNAEVTIFGGPEGNMRVASTIRDYAGQRNIDTVLDDQNILDTVLGRGQEMVTEIELFGVQHYAHYSPLLNAGGNPIGMLFVGFSNEYAVASTNQMLIILVVIGVVGLILAAMIMYFLVLRITKPIGRVADTLGEVASGNLNVNIDRASVTKDEVGKLTNGVLDLVDVIKSVVDDLAKFEHIYNVDGDIEYRMDVEKYQNSFRDMVTGSNNLLDNVVSDVLGFLGTLAEVNEGNFHPQIKKLPGKKIVLENAINSTTANMIAIKSEIETMINSAAVKGDLHFVIDDSKYKGDWRELMKGLNQIAAAVDAPIVEIRDVMTQLAKGQISGVKVKGNYAGDFLEMSGAVNQMIENLESYLGEVIGILGTISGGDLTRTINRDYIGEFNDLKKPINNIVTTLNKTMSEISSASEQVLSGANQISTSATDLASGAQEQASSVQELNATIDMISQQTRQNAENAENANELSNKSTSNAQGGNEAMKQMVDAMTQIKDSSNNISKIVKTIQDIAFQTNLLALNASVEAARAGEHGRGFSVVADEVRTLAGRSQEAATETTALIQDSISRVEAGSSIAESTSESLDAIVASASEVLAIISNISAASKEQAEAIAQLSGGLDQISSVTQNNSAVSEETAAASEELTSQAEVLRQLVAFFKV